MPDLLRDGETWLTQKLNAHCASQVTYRQDPSPAETFVATFGRTEYEVEDEYGSRIKAQVMDFVILASAFPFDEPKAGDRITADGATYEVMELAGLGHWRWSDPYRTQLRIHTREVG